MRKIIIAVFLLCSIMLNAKPVELSMAERVARNFWQSNSFGQWSDMENISAVVGVDQLYVFAGRQRGFVIVAADDCSLPILGYSPSDDFAIPVPDNVLDWLKGYGRQIELLRQQVIEPTSIVTAEWKKYLDEDEMAPAIVTTVSPLLVTNWSQGTYYNSLCPSDPSGQHTATGCVATAMAQVMKYWNHPLQGMGSTSYNHPTYGMQSANFGTTNYDWTNMPNVLNASSTAQQVQAVATLMYHVGVSLVTNYGMSSSGGSAADIVSRNGITYPCVENSLRQYFDYSPQVFGARLNGMGDDRWRAMLRNELDSARPIIYSGFDLTGGHCFVCDGYDSQDHFHFNWGWGGSSNGYFAIGSLNPSVGGIGTNSSSTFNLDNMAVFGIRPAVRNSASLAVVSITSDDTVHATISGSGSYSNFTDLVTLTVATSDGYRFDCWSDGSRKLPRQFWANGDVSLTAHIVPVVGDTIAYCSNAHEGNLMNHYFAIKVNASDLPAGHTLKSVQIFNPYEGDYTIRIYVGDNYSPGTQTYEETFHLPGLGRWETLRFSQLVPVSNSNNLWIVGRCMGNNYPIPVTTYCGNQNGGWISTNGVVWSQLTDMTVMCRAIFSQPTDALITAVAADTSQGTVQGAGYYALGESCTLTAVPSGDNIFDHWDDGSTTNPRTFTVGNTASYTAYFSGCGISILPAVQDFSAGLDCWTSYSASSSNAASMTVVNQSSWWGTMDYFQFCSQSYSDAYDQYLISPRILAPNAIDMTLSYRCQGTIETFNIEYSTTDNNPASFTHVVRSVTANTNVWDTIQAFIPSEAKYIAIHYTTNHGYYLMVDDIQLEGQPLPSHVVSVVSESPTMGTVTGGGIFQDGATITIEAIPNSCYTFTHWQDGSTQNPRTVVVVGDMTYMASFTPTIFYGTESLTGCDSVWWHGNWYDSSTSSASYSTTTSMGCDSIVTLILTINHSVATDTIIVAADSYTIDGEIYTESAVIEQLLTTQSGCDSLVTIYLEIIPQEEFFSVTASANNSLFGQVVGGGQYAAGTGVELLAVPFEGYVFTGWDNGETQNPYTLIVESDTSVVALFEVVQGIAEPADLRNIQVQGLRVKVSHATGHNIDVVDVVGRRVAHVSKAISEQSILLPGAGVYFVRIGNAASTKIIVL